MYIYFTHYIVFIVYFEVIKKQNSVDDLAFDLKPFVCT